MGSSKDIRSALDEVAHLHQLVQTRPGLAQGLLDVKNYQSRRFADTYGDLLESSTYKRSATFFLEDLYGARDYTQRDAQFARIAGALERTFPAEVGKTAATLADLHSLTEKLDLAVAEVWCDSPHLAESERYASAWIKVGERQKREYQLRTVIEIGQQLTEITRKRGLRLLLKMMRRPATLAGLASLQGFLERGFDSFYEIAKKEEYVQYFLVTVKARETQWIDMMFDLAVSKDATY